MNLRGRIIRSSTSLLKGCIVLALAAGAVGCRGPRYEPTVPMQARTGDVDITLKYLHTLKREFTFETHSTLPHRVRNAWLTVPSRAACSDGAKTETIRVDGEAATVFGPGTHTVEVQFGAPGRSYREDLVVDLELEGGDCLRVPAISQSIPMQPNRPLVLIAALQAEGNADLSGLRGVAGVRLGAGGWLGPVLATAEAGIGGGLCNRTTCGQDGKGQLNNGIAFPLAASARVFPLSYTANGFFNTAMLGARYTIMPVRLPALDGDRHFAVHGLHAILGWAVGDGAQGPFWHTERTAMFEIGIPIGIWVYPDASTNTVAFGSGFDIRVDIPE